MNVLNYLKMISDNQIYTGFRDKYNVLVDRVIYDVTATLNSTAGTVLTFYTNVGEIDVVVPVSLASLTDIQFTNPQPGQTIVYNGTNWTNSYPALATLSDVRLTNVQTKDVLLYDGTNWVNGISENNDYTSNIFINDGDTYTSTISTLDEILGLLAPPKPGNLSTKALTVNPIYVTTPVSVIQSKTGIARTFITDDTTPIIEFNPYTNSPASTNNGAYNAALGTLNSTLIKDEGGANTTSTTTNVTFTTASEAGTVVSDGTNFNLTVTDDFDYHYGITGKLGFWKAFLSRVQILTPLTFYPTEQHRISMTHSLTGTTALSFFIDNPVTPTITTPLISTTALGTTKISGVPTLITNDPIECIFNVNNAIKTFYIASIANAQSAYTTSVTTNESGIKTYNSVYNADLLPLVQTGKYTENTVMTLNGYNSKSQTISSGNTATTTATISTTQAGKTMRIDTMSNETLRKVGATGQYPASGYGGTYDSTQSLLSNEELQMIGGSYRYPYLDHSTNYPVAGPNYSTISGWRYVTFVLPIVAKQNIVVNFSGASSFNAINQLNNTMTTSVWRLYVKVDGVTGWVDGNAAYVSGNPSNNGDAAMVVAGSSATQKTVTFGTATRTGNCYIRIGLFDTAKSYPIQFTGVTITTT